MGLNDVGQTIPIIFSGGSYGTYLEWVLTTLTSDCKIVPPFNTNGNSHKFKGNHLININGWTDYVKKNLVNQFVRLHPKVTKDESINNNISLILTTASKIIYIYPDNTATLLVINNYFSKIWSDWWDYQFCNEISPAVIYKNWPVPADTPIKEIPHWIKREFLSFYLMPAWLDQVGTPIETTDSILPITVSDLLYNFKNTINIIKNFINIPFIKSLEDLLPIHNQMLSLQKFTNHDILCNQIVNHAVTDVLLDWQHQPLTLVSESWIQWRFRELGYKMACHGLDMFPTNTVQLKELLYKS